VVDVNAGDAAACDGVVDVEGLLTFEWLSPKIAALHAAHPPTNARIPATMPPVIAKFLLLDRGLASTGAFTAVHRVPSQYRCPGSPLGFGYQPGGVGEVMTRPPVERTEGMQLA
jgi:hypothetical protein